MVTMPSTEASARSSTTHPTANTISPLTRVNTARLFSSGCDWPSLFNDRGERGRVLAASGISATLLRSRSVEEDCSRVEGDCSPHGTARNHFAAAGGSKLSVLLTGGGNELRRPEDCSGAGRLSPCIRPAPPGPW